jgi:hypothetical protein
VNDDATRNPPGVLGRLQGELVKRDQDLDSIFGELRRSSFDRLLNYTRQRWELLRANRGEERFYVFSLMVNPLGEAISVCANSEAALDREARRRLDVAHYSAQSAKAMALALRWQVGDWTYSLTVVEPLPLQRIVGGTTLGGELMSQLACDVLKTLDAEEAFGEHRPALVLTTSWTDIGFSNLPIYARPLNSPEHWARFVEDYVRASEAWAVVRPSPAAADMDDFSRHLRTNAERWQREVGVLEERLQREPPPTQ